MSHFESHRSHHEPRRRRIAQPIVAGLIVLLGFVTAVSTFAEDTRPTDIPYDTPGEIPQLYLGDRQQTHRLVVIHNGSLDPKQVTVKKGQHVAWISASAAPSVVVFEREVAKRMICHSLINFSIHEDELKSAPIHAGELASFCDLKPGRYRYKVTRSNPQIGQPGSAARRLEGLIIVE